MVQLTEEQIRQIVQKQIIKMLNENTEEEGLGNFGRSLSAGLKAGAAALRGNYQANKDMTDLYGANSNVEAEKRLRDIDNACRQLRNQYRALLDQRKQLEAYCKKKGLASLQRKPWQKNSINAKSISTSGGNKFGQRKYTQADGGIGV